MPDIKLEITRLFNDREKEEIKKFINNEDMFKAVKKVVLSSIYFDGTIKKEGIPDPLHNWATALTNDPALSDAKVGKMLKSGVAGMKLLVEGFALLARFDEKEIKEKSDKPNPGR